MPRIAAATLAEHRAARLAQLLDAGRALLVARGVESVTMAAVARHAGLTRSSVYEYFGTVSDLRAAVLDADAGHWALLLQSEHEPDDPLARAVRDCVRRGEVSPGRAGRFVAAGLAALPRD